MPRYVVQGARLHIACHGVLSRFKAALEPLGRFPRFGAPLEGRWSGFRFLLGPWRWMLIVYRYDEHLDRVAIVTIRDARSARSPRI